MKKRLLSLLMVVAMLVTWLPTGILSVSAAQAVKTIVCMGDSITAGSQSTDGLTYPYRLAQMLGSGYTVKNQGRSGNCMYGGGTQTNNQYDLTRNNLQADITAADTVIIMLGTNDTKYWTDETLHESYVARYQETIATFKEWNPNLRFILATPPTSMVTNATGEYSNTLLESITAAITNMYTEKYAQDANITMIDVNAKTKGWNTDHAEWYADNVHFNNAGYERLANVFYEEFWDTTVHSVAVDGYTTKIDNTASTIKIVTEDETALRGKTAAITVAANSSAPTAVSLDSLPATFTVTAPRDGLTRTYTVTAISENDLERTLIYTADDLKALQGKALTGDYKLMANVDVSDENWTPITSLSGTFDGNGMTVTVNTTVLTNNYGFITTVNADGVLQDLTIEGSVDGNAKNNIGVFAYRNDGVIENCTNNAALSNAGANAYAAGIVAYNYGLVNRCANTATIAGENNYIAGIAAALKSGAVVANCYNTGAITINQNGAGGIVGDATATGSTIINCYNTGDLTSHLDQENNKGRIVGGILGSGGSNASNGVVVSNCWNTGTLTVPGESGEIGTRMAGTTQINNFTSTAVAADAVAALNAALLTGVTYNGTSYDLNVWAEGPSFTGEQKAAMPQDENGAYHLRTREHFDWWVNAVGSNPSLSAVLETDIDLTDETWTPLCAYATGGYKGTFDGGNHTITGLTIANTTEDRTGLFGYIAGGTVKNVRLENVTITSTKQRVGGIVGQLLYGTIANCTVTGTITVTYGASACVGGIVGQMGGNKQNAAVVEDCVNEATVTLTHSGAEADVMVGGVVGQSQNGSHADSIIRNCVNNGTITGDATLSKKVAGIAGEVYVSVVNCYNTGAITGKADIGGVVGVSYNNTLSTSYDTPVYVVNNYNTGAITAASNMGGIAGRVNMSSHMYNCYTLGSFGAYANAHTVGNVANNYYCSDTATANRYGTGKTAADMQTANFVRLLNNYVIEKKDDAAFAALGLSKWAKGADGYPVLSGELADENDVVDNSTLIETAAQLLAINGQSGAYMLANDIIITAEDVTTTNPYLISTFTGTLEGAGHTITNNVSKAIFSSIDAAGTVKNLTIDGAMDFGSAKYVAALAIHCYGVVDSVTLNASVTSTGGYVGGLVWYLHDGGVVQNCRTTAAASVSADGYVGGVVSQVAGTQSAPAKILNCVNEATITSTASDYSGGILGFVTDKAYVIVDGCVNKGDMNTKNQTGGIVGGNLTVTNSVMIVTNCTNTGTLTGGSYVGGIVGQIQNMNTGDSNTAYILNCVNTGALSSTSSNRGGIVGNTRGGNNTVYVSNVYSTMGNWVAVFKQTADPTYYMDNLYTVHTGTPSDGSTAKTLADMQAAGFVLTLDSYQPSEAVAAVLDAHGITLKTWEAVSGATPVLGTDAIGSKGGVSYDGDVLLIGNELQLLYFHDQAASNPSLSARLTADIALTDEWAQLAVTYTGVFDGDGHTISGFKQSGLSGNNVTGLFQYLGAAGTIQNLTLEGNIDCPGAVNAGAFVCQNYGLIYGCTNKVDIVDEAITRDETGHLTTEGGYQNVGGIAGINNSGARIDSCVNEGIVTAFKDYAGGIAGQGMANSLIVNCSNSGEVAHTPGRNADTGGSGSGGILGGAGGGVTAYVINCSNAGLIYDNNTHRGYIGGIVGDRGFSYNCYNIGTVWYKGNAGGGYGISGRQGDGSVEHCYTGYSNNNDKNNGSIMTLAAMQTADFAATLNEGVTTIPEAYQTILAGTTLAVWTQGEDGYPVLADSVTITVTFYGKYNSLIANKAVSSATELETVLTDTKAPALGGYLFTSWDVDMSNIQDLYAMACMAGGLTVTAVYEESPSAKQYSLSGLVDMTAIDGAGGAVTTETQLSFDQRITVTNATENTVAYWVLDGAKVGFGANTYTFYVSGNNTIAVVFDDTSELTADVVLQQATAATDSEGQNTLTVVAQTSIPSSYTLKSCGVYYTGSVSVLKALATNPDAVDADTYVQVASSKTTNQQYMTHLLNVVSGKTRYARAYAIVTKDGVDQILWSDTVVQFKTTADGVAIVKGSI